MVRALLAAWCLIALAALWPAAAGAALPARYAPIVVQASGLPERHEFDLTPALQRARTEGKRLYVYLGAHDCGFCRRYEAFLHANADALVPAFAQRGYLLVDLRSALGVKAPQLYWRIGAQAWPYAEFQRRLGDERAQRLVYPSVWLLDADARPLMPMPAGTGTFETVAEQLEILDLVH